MAKQVKKKYVVAAVAGIAAVLGVLIGLDVNVPVVSDFLCGIGVLECVE